MRILCAVALLLSACAAHSVAATAAPAADTRELQGTILQIFTCPVCPPRMNCKPCIGDHLVVAEENADSTTVRIFTPKPSDYPVGGKYRFVVRKVPFGYALVSATAR
jgi:hypothetical protein